MTKIPIDIGDAAEDHIREVFSYYDSSLKTTVDGLPFQTYYGLRQYYVTGGVDKTFLALTDPKEIQQLSRQYKWGHYWDLRMRLLQALIHNVRLHPEIIESIPITDEIHWHRDTKLNPSERVWLDIIISVNTNR